MPADGPTADDWLGSGSSSFVCTFSFSQMLIPDSYHGFSNQLNFRFASVGTLVLEAVRISTAEEEVHAASHFNYLIFHTSWLRALHGKLRVNHSFPHA